MSAKKSKEGISYGNMYGLVSFGALNLAGTGGLKSSVLSGVQLQAFDSLHYSSMENFGNRAGWTLNRCPGVYTVKCGDNVDKNDIGIFFRTENGDVVIQAPNGRIRLFAKDIDIRADGPDNTRGTINLDSNQSVNIKTGTFDVKADHGIRIYTPASMKLVGNTNLRLVSNFLHGLTGALANLPNKEYIRSTLDFENFSTYIDNPTFI